MQLGHYSKMTRSAIYTDKSLGSGMKLLCSMASLTDRAGTSGSMNDRIIESMRTDSFSKNRRKML